MTQDDFFDFQQAYSAAWMFHKELPAPALAMAFRQLSAYPLNLVLAAIDAHCRDSARGQYGPKPADIVFQIERHAPEMQRPGPDEAWAIAAQAIDENNTVVWTQEIAEAFSAARMVLEMGDKVGARVAFKDTYERLVSAAKMRMEPARWAVCLGFDKEHRRVVIEDAVRARRLTVEEAGRHIDHLPEPGDQPVTLALLEASISEAAKTSANAAKTAENLLAIRNLLANKSDLGEWARQEREERRRQEAARRDELMAQFEKLVREREAQKPQPEQQEPAQVRHISGGQS